MSAPDEAPTRSEFNAGMKSLRERMDLHNGTQSERLARLEALLMQVDARALAEAEDRGRTNARLEIIEKQQKEDREAAAERSDAIEAAAEKRSVAQDLWIRGIILLVLAGGFTFVLKILEGAVH